MISDRCDIKEFMLEAKGKNYQDIICLAEREATAAERRAYHSRQAHGERAQCGEDYARCLKGFITYMRYGVKPSRIDRDALTLFDDIRNDVHLQMRPLRIQH